LIDAGPPDFYRFPSIVEPFESPAQQRCELDRLPGFGYDPPLAAAYFTTHEVMVERNEQTIRFRIELECAGDKDKPHRELP
jgi:hypothetical protein